MIKYEVEYGFQNADGFFKLRQVFGFSNLSESFRPDRVLPPNSLDAFAHHYGYDADNRITEVYTSKYPNVTWTGAQTDPLWDKDAKYFYYKHGPLARTELGNDKVQGIDYAYTLQGWIKGVNSETLDITRDMGLGRSCIIK